MTEEKQSDTHRKFIAGSACGDNHLSLMAGSGNFVATMYWMMPDGEWTADTQPIWYNYLHSRAFEDRFVLQEEEGWKLEAEMNEIFVGFWFTVVGHEPLELDISNDLLLAAVQPG